MGINGDTNPGINVSELNTYLQMIQIQKPFFSWIPTIKIRWKKPQINCCCINNSAVYHKGMQLKLHLCFTMEGLLMFSLSLGQHITTPWPHVILCKSYYDLHSQISLLPLVRRDACSRVPDPGLGKGSHKASNPNLTSTKISQHPQGHICHHWPDICSTDVRMLCLSDKCKGWQKPFSLGEWRALHHGDTCPKE